MTLGTKIRDAKIFVSYVLQGHKFVGIVVLFIVEWQHFTPRIYLRYDNTGCGVFKGRIQN